MSNGRFWLTTLPMVAAWLGYWIDGLWTSIACGCALAGGVMAWDALRTVRLRSWLNMGATEDPPGLGERHYIAKRLFRLLSLQRKATRAADARLTEFLAAIRASPNGVTLLDDEQRIVWCNPSALEHFGFEMPRDEQQLVRNLVRDPAFVTYLAASDFAQEAHITRPSGMRVAVQLHAYGDDRLLMLSRDVTAIEQAAQMRRDFVANVSHEVRTPLTVMKGFVETLQTLKLSESERRHYLGLMAEQASRMDALVADLLTLSRIEALPIAPLDRWLDVNLLLLKLEQHMQQALGHLGDFSSKISWSGPLELAANEQEAFGAALNLLTNAMRYSPAGAAIRLDARLDVAGNLLVSVSDQGLGIAPEHLTRLTERFYRVDNSRSRETGGTGLGLAIVKHTMQRHGGSLSIQSEVGVGSSFTLQWPARRVRHPDAEAS